MSDETRYEKTFKVTTTLTVTAKEPLTLVNQQTVELLVRSTLAKLEGMALHGVGAPTAFVKSAPMEIAEVPDFKPEINPVIILGMVKGDALVLTDDAKKLLEAWHIESHGGGLKPEDIVKFARLLYPQKPDGEPPKAA